MPALADRSATLSPTSSVEEVVRAYLKNEVVRIDREGRYPADIVRKLGAAGAFVRPVTGTTLAGPVHASRVVSRTCGSTGFLTWCQNASAWYLAHTENAYLRERYFAAVGDARQLAGTALSNPVKHFAGFEPLKLKGARVPGGFQVSGTLPWVSNLGPDHTFAIVFSVGDTPAMAYVRADTPGVSLLRCATFAALEGTATLAVRFEQAFVRDEDLLAMPAQPFVRKIQPGFMLLQIGMGLGLIEGALDDIAAANRTHAHANRHLPEGAAALADALAALDDKLPALLPQSTGATSASATSPVSADYFRAVARLRLETAELALRATVSASLHSGANGFIASSPPQRRLREAHFFAILTPSIRHLRHVLHTPSL